MKSKTKYRLKKSVLIYVLLFFIVFYSRIASNSYAEPTEATLVTNQAELVAAIANGGYIKLNNDITLSSNLTVKTTMTLDLNGYVLRQSAKAPVINGVSLNSKTLTITDSRPTENPHYFIKNETKAWTYVETPEEGVEYEVITGGIITGGYNTKSSAGGGGAFQMDGKTDYIIIDGGTIVGNYAVRAGGASYGGVLTLNQGQIIGNAAGKFAGAIALSGNFTMHGGVIKDNYSPPGTNEYDFNITGISIGSSSNFLMTAGLIEDNIATVKSGTTTTLKVSDTAKIDGNIYLQNGIQANIEGGEINGRIRMTKGSFIMSGGIISGGNADDAEVNYFGTNGGGVSVEGGNFTMTGGSITGNNATENGGGVYVSGGTFTMSGGTISGNVSNHGGGIYVSGGTVTVEQGTIDANKALTNGGGITIEASGNYIMNGGYLSNNIATNGNGGGIYISDGDVEINGGIIIKNTVENSGNGGGISVYNGNITMSGGSISENKATLGGGFFLQTGTFIIQNGSTIKSNQASNGGGGYVNDGTFNLTGGTTTENVATENGGGYYIINTTTATLSNGIISNNKALNGGGFYQTQDSEHATATSLSGECYVNNNTASGNGGGIYVDGGSTFRMTSGKVIYNKATGLPSSVDVVQNGIVPAKNSSGGVGGGVYIANGIFTMKGTDGTTGDAAIFGNIANHAADDLFALGSQTTFDAIPVSIMKKDDAYLNSTDWFEDYPLGETHNSLLVSDNGKSITSNGRYKNITNISQMVTADSVLTTSHDYICITMGAKVGSLIVRINDLDVGTNNSFIYKLYSDDSDVDLRLSVKKGKDTKIVNVPIGAYTLTIEPTWSWKYIETVTFNINKGSETTIAENTKQAGFNIVGGQTVTIDTDHTIKENKYYTKNIYKKIALKYTEEASGQ